ncbi:MAG: hypothetical protein ACR2M4_07885 [Actinomycetota bacterium]
MLLLIVVLMILYMRLESRNRSDGALRAPAYSEEEAKLEVVFQG